MSRPLVAIPDGFPIKRLPTGARSIPLPIRSAETPKVVAEACGSGERAPRLPHLDEVDGDTNE